MRGAVAFGFALCLLATASPAAASGPRAKINARTFDRAWSLVGDRYWDRSMRGLDWNRVRDRYYPRALAARDEKQLYAVLNTMLGQLDDSHVYATAPADISFADAPETAPDGQPGRRIERLDGDILLIGFDQFEPGDDRWLARAITASPSPSGVILDLRGNAGGRDDILDRIAGLFTPGRELLIRLTGKKVIEERSRSAKAPYYRGPLAVLVGPQTASAAEILAYFLGESGRAFTLGERTAGAVTGGVDYRLPGGGRLTVAEYDIRTATGTRLEGEGFMPGYRVSAARAPRDAALARAAALLRGTKPP